MEKELQKEKTYDVIISDRRFFHKKDDLIVECRPDDIHSGESFYITERDGSYCYLFEDDGKPEWHKAVGKTYTDDYGVRFITMLRDKLLTYKQLVWLTKSNYEEIFKHFKNKTVIVKTTTLRDGVKYKSSSEGIFTKVEFVEKNAVNVYYNNIDNMTLENKLMLRGATILTIDGDYASIVNVSTEYSKDLGEGDQPIKLIDSISIEVKKNMIDWTMASYY